MLLKTSPVRRPKMSVSRPDNGWRAALAIRYDEASHDRRVKELKLSEIGVASVATMVESRGCEYVHAILMNEEAYPRLPRILQPTCSQE